MRKRFGFMNVANLCGNFYYPIFSWDKPPDERMQSDLFKWKCDHRSSIDTNREFECDQVCPDVVYVSLLCVSTVQPHLRRFPAALLSSGCVHACMLWSEYERVCGFAWFSGYRSVLKFWTHRTTFYCLCDRSEREKAWRSRKRVAQAT